MEKVRRSTRTPKQKLETKIPKTNIHDKNDVAVGTSASNKEIVGICKRRVSKKNRVLGSFVIDCGHITGEHRFALDDLKSHLQDKIKVKRKRNDPRVKVEIQDTKILIHAEVFIEKTYIKYLMKLFLKAKKLNSWIRIINGKRSYTLEYFEKN